MIMYSLSDCKSLRGSIIKIFSLFSDEKYMQNSYSLRFLCENDDLGIDKDLLDETHSWNDFLSRL